MSNYSVRGTKGSGGGGVGGEVVAEIYSGQRTYDLVVRLPYGLELRAHSNLIESDVATSSPKPGSKPNKLELYLTWGDVWRPVT